MITIEKILFLKRISIFKSLNSHELRVIAMVTTEEELAVGEVLFHEGQPGDRMYFVVDGRIRIFTGIPPKVKGLATFEAGDFFGEMGLYDDKPRAASAMAQQPSSLLVLRKGDFCELIAEYPDVALGIMKELNQRIRATNVKLSSVERHLLDKTGNLYSKDYFLECITIELLKSKKNDAPLSFVTIKISFQNDSTPSAILCPDTLTVEQVLCDLGRILTLHQRPNDLAARFDDNKIAIMLSESGKPGAEAFTKRVQKDIDSYLASVQDGKKMKINIGYAITAFPDDSDERDKIIALLEKI
ncbi:MAG: cyclic nucleotide-binding domain-containing protein [Candidatus Riflebacteria bacterium]|nr:cyclic nucleotide-binding domain-containing protein [Candidatus Riflebacteria bacterium]